MTTHLLLPGQAAAPEGPVDMNAMYVLHHAFRRDLRDFVDAVAATPLDEPATWAALDARWRAFAAELHAHHTKEDEILWPLLEERCEAAGDHASLTVLAEMEAEHAVVDPALEACAAGFVAMTATPDDATRAALLGALASLRRDLDAHLGHEESDAIAIVQRRLGAAEWQRIEREKFRGKVSLRQAAFMLPWMFKGLPDDVAARMRRDAGPAFSAILRLNQRGFQRRERLAFAHAGQNENAER